MRCDIRTILGGLVLVSCLCFASRASSDPAVPGESGALGRDSEGILAALLKAADERHVDVEQFKQWCEHPDDEIRKRCALVAGQIGTPELAEPILGLTSDRSQEVRQAAVYAIGRIPDPQVLALLILIFENDKSMQVRATAAQSLANTGAPEAMKALVSPLLLARNDPEEKRMIATVLMNLYKFHEPTIIPQVMPWLSEDDPQLRYAATYCLIRLNDARVADALVKVAETEQTDKVRALAVRALGALKHEKSPELLRRSLKDASWLVRVNALKAVAELGDNRFQSIILPLIRDGNPSVRFAAIEALGAIGGPTATEALASLTIDGSTKARELAINGLVAANGPDALPLVHRFRWSDNWHLRRAFANAASALGRMEILEQMLEQERDPRVISEIIADFTPPLSPSMTQRLFQALRHSDPVVRAVASETLGRLKPRGALQALLASYRELGAEDLVPDARASIVSALPAFDDDLDAKLALIDALKDRDYVVRRAAADAARVMGIKGRILDPSPVNAGRSDRFYREVVRFAQGDWKARIVTGKGTMVADLFARAAPLTAFNFVKLARTGFYDGLTFQRLVPNFVVQGGCPRGDGWGTPGYSLRDEINPEPFDRGTLGMALSGRDTGGSQFFITHSDQPHLSGVYTAFGRLSNGLDVLDQIDPDEEILTVEIEEAGRALDPG